MARRSTSQAPWATGPAPGEYEFACPLPDLSHPGGRCDGNLSVTIKDDGRVLINCRRPKCGTRPGFADELAWTVHADSIDDLKANFQRYLAPYARPGAPYRRKSTTDRTSKRVDSLPYDEQLATFRRRVALMPDLRAYLMGPERGFNEWTLKKAEIGYARAGELRGVVYGEYDAYVFPIRDATGELVNVYRRFPPDRMPFGRLKWCGLRGRPGALYPSPPSSDTVIVTEGLADALIARQHGLDAVTATTGAAVKWPEEWLAHVRGALVAVIYDADAQAKARKLAAFLKAGGARDAWAVDLADFAGLESKQDVSDLFLSGYSASDFRALLNASYVEHRAAVRQSRRPR